MSKTELMVAAYEGNTAEVQRLIPVQAGMQDGRGQTALMFASSVGHVECVRLLVERERRMQTMTGETALMFAAYNNRADVIRILLPHERGMRDRTGQTALMSAIYQRSVDAVHLLHEEAGQQDDDGLSALMIAAKSGWDDIVRLLCGMEARLQDRSGLTALMCAAHLNMPVCTRLLASAEARMQTTAGKTALMFAAESGSYAVACALRQEYGMQDHRGYTALMYAARRGHTSLVHLLMSEATITDAEHQTALHHAILARNAEAALALLEREAHIQDRYGRGPLDLAHKMNLQNVFNALIQHRQRNNEQLVEKPQVSESRGDTASQNPTASVSTPQGTTQIKSAQRLRSPKNVPSAREFRVPVEDGVLVLSTTDEESQPKASGSESNPTPQKPDDILESFKRFFGTHGEINQILESADTKIDTIAATVESHARELQSTTQSLRAIEKEVTLRKLSAARLRKLQSEQDARLATLEDRLRSQEQSRAARDKDLDAGFTQLGARLVVQANQHEQLGRSLLKTNTQLDTFIRETGQNQRAFASSLANCQEQISQLDRRLSLLEAVQPSTRARSAVSRIEQPSRPISRASSATARSPGVNAPEPRPGFLSRLLVAVRYVFSW
ncbi:Ankyrin repeat protein 1 [Giardia muris]|uniref:Ankyrin repeat protein 1 n=1 Tax=Giardia muris TaxID=5742 RepID=A0A4Z1T744_GIAMU|nr:Ankyrin repeat protein 1 [Giardia muris]|eukprot:TNJ28369.1 Ankyrin repeat protein 1 [Giardia muris]